MAFFPSPGEAEKLYLGCSASTQLLEQRVEVLEARVVHYDLARAAAPGANLHRGSQALGHLLFQARKVAVPARAPAARGALQHCLHQRLGVAPPKAFFRNAVAGLAQIARE